MFGCYYRKSNGICWLLGVVCLGANETFCTHYKEGCCKLSGSICSCCKQCTQYEDIRDAKGFIRGDKVC